MSKQAALGLVSALLLVPLATAAQKKPIEIRFTVKHNGKTVANPDHATVTYGNHVEKVAVRTGKLEVPAEISQAKSWDLAAVIEGDRIEVKNLSQADLAYEDWTLHVADRHYQADYSSYVPKGASVRSTCILVLNSEHVDPGLVIFQTRCRSKLKDLLQQ